MSTITVRREREEERRAVEELTRDAFWNVQVPGCSEHYLAHLLRRHPDFIAELDLVAEVDGVLAGSILYTRAALTDEEGRVKPALTFGPLSVSPAFGRRGVGKKLMTCSFAEALKLGFDTVVIFGNPDNYVTSGFVSCKRKNVSVGGVFPSAMLVKELKEGALDGRPYTYKESEAYAIDEEAAAAFDKTFPPREKKARPSQEMFYILSHASLQ